MDPEVLITIAEVLSIIGSLIFILSALIKQKQKVMVLHCFAHIIFIFSEAVKGLWGSIIQEIFNIARNFTIIIKKNNKIMNIIFVILSLVIGVLVNILTRPEGTPIFGLWYGYFSIIGTFQFSIVTLYSENIKHIKISQGLFGILWGLTFTFGGLLVAGILNFINGALAFISIFFIAKNK